jgi:hypothetical protein
VKNSLFVVPGYDSVQDLYNVSTDEIEKDAVTVLVAVVRPSPFVTWACPVVPPRPTKDGRWFGLFRMKDHKDLRAA